MKYKEIHIWSRETGQYIGNIIYKYQAPKMSEEEFVDLILEHFPQLRGKGWITNFI